MRIIGACVLFLLCPALAGAATVKRPDQRAAVNAAPESQPVLKKRKHMPAPAPTPDGIRTVMSVP